MGIVRQRMLEEESEKKVCKERNLLDFSTFPPSLNTLNYFPEPMKLFWKPNQIKELQRILKDLGTIGMYIKYIENKISDNSQLFITLVIP
jgi:hypothetical protein